MKYKKKSISVPNKYIIGGKEMEIGEFSSILREKLNKIDIELKDKKVEKF